MANMNRFSEGLIDMAERFADVVDAAQGHGNRKGGPGARWLVLPAAGAAAYALATSGSKFARETRGLMQRAKDRAADLPDADLFGRVKEVTGVEEDSTSATQTRRTTSNRSQGQKRRQRTAGQSTNRRKTATTASR